MKSKETYYNKWVLANQVYNNRRLKEYHKKVKEDPIKSEQAKTIVKEAIARYRKTAKYQAYLARKRVRIYAKKLVNMQNKYKSDPSPKNSLLLEQIAIKYETAKQELIIYGSTS